MLCLFNSTFMFYDQCLNAWWFFLGQHLSLSSCLSKVCIPFFITFITTASPLTCSHSHLLLYTRTPHLLHLSLQRYLFMVWCIYFYLGWCNEHFSVSLESFHVIRNEKEWWIIDLMMRYLQKYVTELSTVRWEERDKVLFFNRTEYPTS